MPLVRKPSPTPAAQPRNQPDLAARLLEGSDEERWNAARSAAAAPNGLDLLSEAISRENHPRVREAIFTGLARMQTPESAGVAIQYLRSDDASLRTGALDALRAMPAAVAAYLPRLLKDGDADVRLLACELARAQPIHEAGRMLGEVIATERETNVCAAAIEVLAEVGGPDLLPLMAGCAARFPNDPFLAFAVQIASERIGSQALTRG